MPYGPLGTPRPAASSTMSLTVKLNRPPDPDMARTMAMSAIQNESVGSRIDSISVTEDDLVIDGEVFEMVVIDMILSDNEQMLDDLNELERVLEDAFNTTSVSTKVEAV